MLFFLGMCMYFEGRVKPVVMFAHVGDIRGNSHILCLPHTTNEPDLIYRGSFRPRIISLLKHVRD